MIVFHHDVGRGLQHRETRTAWELQHPTCEKLWVHTAFVLAVESESAIGTLVYALTLQRVGTSWHMCAVRRMEVSMKTLRSIRMILWSRFTERSLFWGFAFWLQTKRKFDCCDCCCCCCCCR